MKAHEQKKKGIGTRNIKFIHQIKQNNNNKNS